LEGGVEGAASHVRVASSGSGLAQGHSLSVGRGIVGGRDQVSSDGDDIAVSNDHGANCRVTLGSAFGRFFDRHSHELFVVEGHSVLLSL
jgi:glucose-6-phosphate-specific signal transduction histidine kinase